jgi:hypothetical protein
MKSFQWYSSCVPSMISSISISFPSLTHLTLRMDPFTPSTTSHLLLLKSLTDLQLTIRGCVEPKPVLMALQPLASVLTKIILYIESADASINKNIRYAFTERDQLSYLLPFRSLTYLSINVPTLSTRTSTCFSMEITSSFIRQYWNKLDRGSIQFYASQFDFVRLFRELLSVTTQTTLSTSVTSAMVSSNNKSDIDSSNSVKDMMSYDNKSLLFGITLLNASSVRELNWLLEEMENSSLLIPSSSPSSTSASTFLPISSPPTCVHCIPTISFQCRLRNREKNTTRAQSLGRDMTDRVKSRGYINMLSFTTLT